MSQDPEKGKAQGAYTQSPTMPSNADAAERRLWALYSEEAAKYDKGLALNWKGDMDAILIFAGLFTASVTAMIVESYKLLKPDSGDQTVALLTQLSQQLAHLSDSTLPAPPQLITNDDPFHPATSVVICNFLFFLSLGFALLCAVGATLVEQWVRQYLQETQAGTPIQNARLREYLHQGIVHFRMLEVVETIPFLLHISLFLFFAGLCIFIYPFNHIIGALCIFIFVICLIFYLIPTLTPIFIRFCPYRTPLTRVFWRLCQGLPTWIRRIQVCKGIPQRRDGNLTASRLFAATSDSESRKQRDNDAIGWLVKSRMDDAGIESVCEVLPLLCANNRLGYYHLVFNLLNDQMLGDRIVDILLDTGSKRYVQGAHMLQRTTTCLMALRTILRASFEHRYRGCFVPKDTLTPRTWFNLGSTLRALYYYPGTDVDHIIPSTKAYIWTQVLWDLRLQLQETSSDAEFVSFATAMTQYFTLFDERHLRNIIDAERDFCSFLPKLASIRKDLRSASQRPSVSKHCDHSNEKANLCEALNNAFRAILVDYILSTFVSGTQDTRHEFGVTSAKILLLYHDGQTLRSTMDESVWLKVTREGLIAAQGAVNIQTLIRDLEVMTNLPELASAYKEPVELILNALRETHFSKLHCGIEHPHRYSHLRKFYYDSPAPVAPSAVFTNLVSHKSTKRAKFLHPVATLSFGGRSIPPDLALEALDTLTLYNALFKHYRGGITDLNPVTFFHSTAGFLTQKNILDYDAALKARLLTLTDSPDTLDVVIQELQDHSSSQQTPSKSHFLPNLIYLLADLNSEGNLPAILFNFDRSDCEEIAQHLVNTLETAEETWRQNSPEWRRKIQEWEKWQNAAKEREKQATRMKKQKRDADAVEGSSEAESAWQKWFDPKDPSEQFSFAGVHEYSKSELDADIKDLGWTSTPRWAIDALRRGIAVHHAGMHKHYQSIVESLFRKKFVRVVIATGTLALGINAPTKTSVFCGDSPFLTALMFRQCAGRAGCRGYDLLGNVVFYGLPMDRVQRLILSKLPSLQPSFPLTSTLTLRLLNLLDGSDYHPVAVNALQSILALPHISFGSKIGKDQLLHHLRFSIEYLRRSRLIGQEGTPINLFAIAAHLYYTEPSNFALVTLMRSSALHQICNQPSVIDARRGFILLMAHLFGRRYLPKAYVKGTDLADLIKRYPSCVVLPSLDEPSRQILLEHERETLHIYTSYAMAYVTEHADELGQDCLLPLTKLDFSGTRASTVSRFQKYLHESRVKFATRSAFVANSGHTD
ncbi:hypothetical protein C8J56DRAFT_1115041 [Mycena floridula]|nr:hypothetical protein C8J56DRAFT_1115041 [Mycena floridula]